MKWLTLRTYLGDSHFAQNGCLTASRISSTSTVVEHLHTLGSVIWGIKSRERRATISYLRKACTVSERRGRDLISTVLIETIS